MIDQCPSCGQKLRPNWTRCPRCRRLLAETAVTAASERLQRSTAWLASGGGLVLFGAVLGFSLWTGDAPGPDRRRGALHAAEAPAPPPAASDGMPMELAGSAASFAAIDARRDANAAYARGDLATALERLEEAVAMSPDDPDARNNLGQVLVRHGRAAEALPHFDAAIAINGAAWSYRFNRARAYGLVNRWQEAVADYRVAAALFPDDHATLYNLGLALLRLRDYPAAVTALEQAVDAAPEQHDFLITLGTAYVGASEADRARETFERFLERAPDDPDAIRVKALLQSMTEAGQ